MEVPFMRAYSLLTIQTCHKRNAPAIGGMAAQIPVKNDEAENKEAYEKVRNDKLREVKDGHDGTWVAHPAMVQLAKEVFDEHMPTKNQIDCQLDNLQVTEEQLLEVPEGPITEGGLRANIEIGIQYISAWLGGRGAVPLNQLNGRCSNCRNFPGTGLAMDKHPEGKLETGEKVTIDLVKDLLDDKLQAEHPQATKLFLDLIEQDSFESFLTLPAYHVLKEGE